MNKRSDPIKDDVLLAFFKELERVQDNQRLLVIITHAFIELLLNTVIDTKCKHGKKRITSNSRDYTHSVKLVLLNEIGIIDNRLFQILDRLRRLRNRAAHEPFFKVNKNDLDFANKSMERLLPVEVSAQENLLRFCMLLVGTIWNEHFDILVPVFAPRGASKDAGV